jgi:hypothetical protein
MAVIQLGCAGRTAYKRGVEAEKRGEAHLAYAYFAKAAQTNPDNQSYVNSIRRLGPMAATHWLTEAKLARAEGRYGDSWKDCMRCLAIQPDRADALVFFDDLMERHGASVAGVRRQWMQEGATALAIEAREPTPERATLPGSGARDMDDPPPTPSPSRRVASGTSRPKPPPGTVVPAEEGTEFIARHRLTRDDNREVASVDGVRIRFRTTHDDLSADFDLYDGDRRIQKIRDLGVGQSKLLLSPEGKWYRLTVLEVDHQSGSVRIGLNPA